MYKLGDIVTITKNIESGKSGIITLIDDVFSDNYTLYLIDLGDGNQVWKAAGNIELKVTHPPFPPRRLPAMPKDSLKHYKAFAKETGIPLDWILKRSGMWSNTPSFHEAFKGQQIPVSSEYLFKKWLEWELDKEMWYEEELKSLK